MNKQQDNITDFIQRHRQALDSASPDHLGWGTLERLLDRLPGADALERKLLADRPLLDDQVVPPAIWDHIQRQLDTATTPNDPLEHFIRQNRRQLDAAEPTGSVWESLEKHLSPSSTHPLSGPPLQPAPLTLQPPGPPTLQLTFARRLLRIAASLALLLSGIGIGTWYAGRPVGPGTGIALQQIAPEYAEMEQYYIRDINQKEQKLQQFTGFENAAVEQDLDQLDNMMLELRAELQNVPPASREKVIRALIDNYKAKAAILERVIDRLENKNENPNSKDYERDRI